MSKESLNNISKLEKNINFWQITPGWQDDIWSIWRDNSIASLDYSLDINEESGSREELVDEIRDYPESEHADTEYYQAFLFQEQLQKDDIVVARQRAHGDIRVYGIGRIISPYIPDHPAKLQQKFATHDHQVGVAWFSLGDDGVSVDIDTDSIVGHKFARLSYQTFETILKELVELEEIDVSALARKLGADRKSTPETSAVEIPASPSDVDLDGLVFTDSKSLVDRVLAALRTGKHVILMGPPGTGKTALAERLAETCSPGETRLVTATADWSTFDTIGGYRPGESGDLEFVPGLFLETFDGGVTESGGWLVVDEINRCDIDKAFGSLFTALTGRTVTLPFSRNGSRIVVDGDLDRDERVATESRYVIPDDWRIIATMNTYDKTSLYDLSYAFMRRFAFVTVGAPTVDEIDIGLVQSYVDGWNDIEDTGEYYRDVAAIWSAVNGSESRKIGPAIVRDILGFLQSGGDYTGALTMYVLPQFEGLPTRQQVGIVQDLLDLEQPSLDETDIREFAHEYFELTESDYERFGE